MGWATEAEEKLKSTEDEDILSTLQDIKACCNDNEPLEVPSSLLLQVLDKLQHHDIEIRCVAITIIASQLRAHNWALQSMMPEIPKHLAQPNILDLNQGQKSGDFYTKLHKELIFAITEIHTTYPLKVMPVLRPIINYIVDATGSHDRNIATSACMFFGNLNIPPVLQRAMPEWLPPVFKNLGKLIPNLLKNMMYHEDLVTYLQGQVSTAGRPRTRSMEFEALSDIRNYAALGLEKLTRIYGTDITPAFKIYVLKWLQSSDWLEQEAMTLALGAYCEGIGHPLELKEILPDVVCQILSFYSSKEPLLRAIACFCAPHFMNVRMKGVKDIFGRMIRGTLNALNDDHCEIQDQALRAMVTLLAYGERDFSAQSRKIVAALTHAGITSTGKSRVSYYECLGHAVGRLQGVLEEAETKALLDPLMEHFGMLQWTQIEQATLEELNSICSSLCVVAMVKGSIFHEFNEAILSKVVPYLQVLIDGPDGVDTKSEVITTHMVAYLDLISAMYEGQGEKVNKSAVKNNLFDVILQILNTKEDKFASEVVQSGMALLGHFCKSAYPQIKPDLESVVDLIMANLDNRSNNIRTNSLWALTHFARSCDEKHEKIYQLGSDLKDLILNLRGQENVIINSALALTILGSKMSKLGKFVLREDIFVHICALLQTPFSQEEDKYEIFHYLCVIITPRMDRVPKDAWIHFCAASSGLEAPNDVLKEEIKTILKDVRTTIGNAAWNKLNATMGQQMAYNMRKKYKLY